jgi:hypothetical protein
MRHGRKNRIAHRLALVGVLQQSNAAHISIACTPTRTDEIYFSDHPKISAHERPTKAREARNHAPNAHASSILPCQGRYFSVSAFSAAAVKSGHDAPVATDPELRKRVRPIKNEEKALSFRRWLERPLSHAVARLRRRDAAQKIISATPKSIVVVGSGTACTLVASATPASTAM